MLNLEVGVLEDFTMEEQVHLTVTATICASIFAVVYYFSTLNQSSFAHDVAASVGMMVPTKEDWTGIRTGAVCLGIFYFFYGASIAKEFCHYYIEAMMRKSMGLSGPEMTAKHAHVKLGPHSYMTLLLSMGCCAFILFLIYIVKVTPFETLVKITPIHKLIQILANDPDLEEEEESKSAGDQLSSRERVLTTCKELEKRMARLEQCLGPLAHSLELLNEQYDLQPVEVGPNATPGDISVNRDAAPAVVAEPDSAKSTAPDPPAGYGLRQRSIVCDTPKIN